MPNAEDVRSRINYIEPTNISFYSNGAKAIVPSNDLVMNPLEDYCIAVDLEVIIPNRKSCSLAYENDDFIKLNFSSTHGTLSFMNGTSGTLTTNFTDIHMIKASENTKECLGIESISIAYNAWLAPEVTIKFIDVRGGSVLLPEEEAYQNGTGLGSVYRSLFTLPSPMFKLMVKGFYGKGATYYLVEESIDISLDSSSGNFEITSKFIGIMYRVYADIPMTYLCAAPFMKNGEEHWNNQISSGVFKFKNKSGTETDMCKFPELRKRIADAAYSEKRQSAAAKGEQMVMNNDEKVSKLSAIRDTYPLKDWLDAEGGHYYLTPPEYTAEALGENIHNFLSLVSGFDESYHTIYLDNFEVLKPYSGEKKCKNHIEEYTYTSALTGKKREIKRARKGNKEFEEVASENTELYNYIMTRFEQNPNRPSMKLFFIPDSTPNEEKRFIYEEIEKRILQCDEEKAAAKKEYDSMVEAAIEEALGFTPSIENIYNLAFAHMETFMEAFYGHMDVIYNQLVSHAPERKKSTYGNTITDVDRDDEELPPYPAFYKETRNNGETRKEMVWPGELPSGYKLEEVNFVKDLLQAASLYSEEAIKMEEYAEKLRQKYVSGGTVGTDVTEGGAPSVIIDKLIPLTVNDFVRKDREENPYMWVKKLDETHMIQDGDSFDDAVIGTFVLRALHYLAVNEDKKREATTFGKLEAANFVRAFGKDYYTDRFFDFIDQYADDRAERRDANSMMNKVTDKTNGTVWNFAKRQLLKLTGGIITGDRMASFALFSGTSEGYFPVGRYSFPEMQKDCVDGVSHNDRYITEDKRKDSADETFFIFHSRDYIKELYDGIEELANEEGYNLTAAQIKEFKDNIDSEYGKDDLVYIKECVHYVGDDSTLKGKVERLSPFSLSIPEAEQLYIKYPTVVDEKVKNSLFDETYYIGQKDIRSKAYLFLSSMPIKRIDGLSRGHRNGNISSVCENGIELRASLLREGSFYWREKCMKETGIDPILTEFDGQRGKIKYKQAKADETYMVAEWWEGKNGSRKETISMETGNVDYINFEPPKGCTESRKRVLAAEFERWAKSDFDAIEPVLSNKKFYKNQSFKEGLNPLSYENDGSPEGMELVRLQMFLRETFFGVSTIFDYYAGNDRDTFMARSEDIKSAFRGFMESLENIYKEKVKGGREAASYDAAVKQAEDPFNNEDIRLSTYMTLKNLYDKWFVAPYKGRNTWRLDKPESDFKTFSYIDSFYHDIGRSINVDVTKVGEWISSCMPSQNIQTTEGAMGYVGKSLYEYLTEIAQNTGGMLIAFPQRIGGRTTDYLSDMFKAYPFNSDWETDESSFVFIYSYKPSEHLGNDVYEDDGMDLSTEQVRSLLGDKGYSIPAFGVSYAKQNQAYFKNITLNTNTPAVTEASITATMAIAAKGAEGARETSIFGQDLYKVKTSYSYQCEFDMMGCIQVMPLMYFQLNNVPFWRGGYIIYNVTHEITAGDMTTHVKGQRLNKYSIPLTESIMLQDHETPDGSYEGGVGASGNNGPVYGSGDVEAAIGDKNTQPNPSVETFPEDFLESNISDTKPIIALTPAHGPATGKGSEWFWSRKLIDQYIIPKLKILKFSDGTSYASNIQRCNKDNMNGYEAENTNVQKGTVTAQNTGTDGYSTRETQRLIGKYGSKRVISVIPHWNGGKGSYFAVFDGNSSKRRTDSQIFGKIMREEAQKVVNRGKNNEFRVMPTGFMKNGVNETMKVLTDSNDGAVGLDCACLLTENFFADYGDTHDIIAGELNRVYINGPKKQQESGHGYLEKDAAGRFVCGEGWLFSDEGMTAISDMHVEAIRRYINNLQASSISSMDGKNTAPSNDIYTKCANMIGCEVEALKAVIKVESNGSGFFGPGKPAILFEGHIFWKYLREDAHVNPADYVSGNEDIVYPEWTKSYYKGGMAEYDRLERAKAIHETAALKSTSWGMLQIMGFNYAACGCESVQELVKLMSESADNQILLGSKFINSNSEMKNALINKDWTTFARKFNGPKYYENKYDRKLQAAYDALKG